MAGFKEIKEDLERLEKSEELRSYLGSHSGAYFVSAFMISGYDEMKVTPWVLEYYWPEGCTVSTFCFDKGKWIVSGDDKALQKESHHLEALDLESVKFQDITGIVGSKIVGETPFRIIVALGCQKKAPLWNATIFTKSFKMINVKVDAVSGEVLSFREENLFDYRNKAPV